MGRHFPVSLLVKRDSFDFTLDASDRWDSFHLIKCCCMSEQFNSWLFVKVVLWLRLHEKLEVSLPNLMKQEAEMCLFPLKDPMRFTLNFASCVLAFRAFMCTKYESKVVTSLIWVCLASCIESEWTGELVKTDVWVHTCMFEMFYRWFWESFTFTSSVWLKANSFSFILTWDF